MECQTKCWDPTLNCRYFTFYRANGIGYNTCYLRSSASGNKAIAQNYISGQIFREIGLYFKCLFCYTSFHQDGST